MARLPSDGLVLLFIAAMTLVQAATLFNDKSYMRQVRQLGVGQGASTSTFNYWWPYPAWTATATTSPPAATAGTATTALFATTSTLQDGVLATMSVPSSDSTSILSFSGTLTTLSDTSITAASPSSSSPSTSSSSPTSTSVATHPNSGFPSRRFFTSPHFFVPLIAAVSGTVVLSVLLWLICRHRRRARTSSSSFSTEGKGWRAVEEPYHRRQRQRRGWWSGLFRGRDEFEETVPGPEYVGVEEDSERDARRLLGADCGRLDIASWAAEAGSQLPKRVGTRRSGSMSVGQPLLPLAPPSVFLNDLSDEEEEDDAFEGDDDEDKPEMQVPWESLRHKSIKRAILAKVDEEKRWTDSMRGVRAARAVRAVGEVGPGGRAEEEMGASRSRSRSTRDGQGRNEGFRIVVESPPLQIPTLGSSPWSLASAFPFPLFSHGDRQREGEGGGGEEDKYTPVPTGMRGQSQSRSRRSSPRYLRQQRRKQVVQGLEPTSPGRGRPAYRPSPSVLRMRSPPSVMTPQMESALCFTPVVGASARMGGGPSSRERTEDEEGQGTIYTKTYRDRTDRAIRRVDAIVESAWSERGRVRN